MKSTTEFSILTAAISPFAPDSPQFSFDPDRLVDLAEFHRLVPHVHRYLDRAGNDLPQRLCHDVRTNAARNLLLFAHTCRVVQSLRATGMDAVALKGPVLAHQLYGDISMRMSTDVDVLVPRDQFVAAASHLIKEGYRPGIPVAGNAISRHLIRQHDLAFAHHDGTLLELHAGIAQPHYSYAVDLSTWFREARDVEIGGSKVRALSLSHAASLAIIHGTKHVWSRLDLVADVAAFGRTNVDWTEVAEVMHRAGAARAAAVAAHLARSFTGWTPPLATSYPEAARLAELIHGRIVRQEAPTYWQARMFDLAVRERLSDRFRYVARLGLKLPL